MTFVIVLLLAVLIWEFSPLCVCLDPREGGPEAAGGDDTQPRPGRAPSDDVTAGRAGQDSTERLRSREETGAHHGTGLQQDGG